MHILSSKQNPFRFNQSLSHTPFNLIAHIGIALEQVRSEEKEKGLRAYLEEGNLSAQEVEVRLESLAAAEVGYPRRRSGLRRRGRSGLRVHRRRRRCRYFDSSTWGEETAVEIKLIRRGRAVSSPACLCSPAVVSKNGPATWYTAKREYRKRGYRNRTKASIIWSNFETKNKKKKQN